MTEMCVFPTYQLRYSQVNPRGSSTTLTVTESEVKSLHVRVREFALDPTRAADGFSRIEMLPMVALVAAPCLC